MKTIYAIIAAGGDNNAVLHWFSDIDHVNYLLSDDDEVFESYYLNDGEIALTLKVGPEFDFAAAGIHRIDGRPADQFFA